MGQVQYHPDKHICVLAFHDLIENGREPHSPYSVTVREFENILLSLGNCGRTACGPFELRESPRPAVAVTFDDGFAETLRLASPLLDKYGVPAAVFIPSSYVGKARFASSEDLRAWVKAGREVGAHGRTHVAAEAMSVARFEAEMSQSRKELEEILGLPIEMMSFVGGSERKGYAKAAFEAGFRVLFTSKPDFAERGAPVIGRFTILRTMRASDIHDLLAKGDVGAFKVQRILYRVHKAIGTRRYAVFRNIVLRPLERMRAGH